MPAFSRSSPLFFVLIALSGIGCGQSGPRLGTVTGVVEMDGAPVPDARVVFVPQSKGSPSYGATDKNGAFRMGFSADRQEALVGEHSVLIEDLTPKKDEDAQAVQLTSNINIPKKYEQPGLLSASVQPGRNHFKFELDSVE